MQEVLKLSSMGIHTGVQCRDREQKKFCGHKTTKPVPVVQHVEI